MQEDGWARKQISTNQLLKLSVHSGHFNGYIEWWDRYFVKLRRAEDGSRLVIHKSRIISMEKITSDGQRVLEQAPDVRAESAAPAEARQ